MLHQVLHPDSHSFASCITASMLPPSSAGRRRWTTGELTEIVSALSALRTDDIARTIGVNPKALRSVLQRHGISIRALREQAKKDERSSGLGLVVRRSNTGPSASYGATALSLLPDNACRWPLGDPAEPGFAFCGARRMGHMPYCRHHAGRAYKCEDGHGC